MAQLNGSQIITPPHAGGLSALEEPRGALSSADLAPGATAVELSDRRAQELAQELDDEFRSSGVRGCCGLFARLGPEGLTDGLFAMALRKSALPLGHKVLMCVFWTPSAEFADVVAGAFAGRAGEVGDLRRLAISSCDSFMGMSGRAARDFAWFVGCLRRAEALKRFWADGGDAGRRALPQLAAGLMTATLRASWRLARYEWARYEGGPALRHTLLEFAGAAKRVVNLLRPPAGSPVPDYGQMLADACGMLHSYVHKGRGGTLAMTLAYTVDNNFWDYAAVYGLPGLLATVRNATRSAAKLRQRPELAGRIDDDPAAGLLQGLGPQLHAYVCLRFLVLRTLARAVKRRKAAALAQITMMPPGGPFPGGEGFHASAASFARAARPSLATRLRRN
jgi:hypothetical protein